MAYGSGPLNKYEYACTVAAALAYLLLRQQDAVGCVAFDEAIRADVPLRTSTSHLNAIVQALDAQRAARQDRPVRRAGAASPRPIRAAA